MHLITGMHRSGTSMVARLFLEAGADFGDPSGFYGPDQWNPEGYFEQREIQAVNMSLIHGPWGRLAYFLPPGPRRIELRASRDLGASIDDISRRHEGRFVKENRFCLTLSAWRRQGAQFESIVLCLRDPHAVAISLRRRNKIPLRLGYQLWRLHLDRLLEASEAIPMHLIRYEHLLEPRTFSRELGAAFEAVGLQVRDVDLERLEQEVVRRDLDHSPTPDRKVLPTPVEQLWSSLRERHRAQFQPPVEDN